LQDGFYRGGDRRFDLRAELGAVVGEGNTFHPDEMQIGW
jgi:hypothetical protein